MVELERRQLMTASVAAAVGAGTVGLVTGEDDDTENAPTVVDGELKRLATTAFGAEVTGPDIVGDGTLVFSLQHPADSEKNLEKFRDGGIGYIDGFQFRFDGSNDDFEELSVPETEEEQGKVRTSGGSYELLAREKDPINGGTERLGVPKTPEGEPIDEFAGSRYSAAGNDPDMNVFVETPDGPSDGHLFTNFEQSPGTLSRMPVSVEPDGSLQADLENAIDLANTDGLRDVGGTRINCYGDLTPWETMISSEENYAHTRVSLTATVGDVLDQGTGVGIRAAHHFWNRPNPTAIQDAVGEYYGDDAWYVQGYWALDGVELLGYHLGADPRDQAPGGGTDMLTPIGEGYPNPYRYGYHVAVREPAADPPRPVKHWAMGRAAWEAPDFQRDRKTVYGCSDGDSKGIYKFVARRPIPSYQDPMDIDGTLYAPKVANSDAATDASPADVDLEIEWIELGSASNGQVESWIAEYDDITQVDYLKTHAEDWTEGDAVTASVLEEADREVVANGNQDYISAQDIVEWARQHEERGPHAVDDRLERVPFLETRAAAKEIGASIEFNKAEGVDSADAGPGDYVYFGISEFNDDMSNDIGDIRTERVDGGVVYRGRLSPRYDIETLEPVIVGPDFSDPAADADAALRNVDNVYVMDDGRVLCLEDGFAESNRSYPNDCVYVFEPDR